MMAAVESLESLEQEFADALAGNRACQWEAGDIADRAIRACTTAKERKVVIGALAALGHCTAQYVRDLAHVARVYSPEWRKPDVAWSLYRACLKAEKRTGQQCWQLLENALEKGWHVREVDALSRVDREPKSTLKATCGDCGAVVSVSIAGMGGVAIPCPVCVGVAEEWHGQDLGTLS